MHRRFHAAAVAATLALSLFGAVVPYVHAQQPTDAQAQADLVLKMTASAHKASVGQTVTFTMVARNKGPDAADEVFIEDTLPSGLAVVSESCFINGGPGPAADGTFCEFTPPLAAGDTVSMTIQAMMTAASPSALTNAACVVSIAGTPDPRPANNCATATVSIAGHRRADGRATAEQLRARPNHEREQPVTQ